MRKWINLLNEYADPEDRMQDPYYRGAAHYAPKALWDRPGFKHWFEGSRVAAPNGEPLIAFHGSYERFTEFKLKSEKRQAYGFNRLGFWFDIDPRTPEYFAGLGKRDTELRTTEGGVMPCVLSIKKPFHLDSEFIFRPDIEKLDSLHTAWLEANKEYETFTKQQRELENRGLKLDRFSTENLWNNVRKLNREYENARAKIISYEKDGGERIDGFHQLMKLLPKGAKSSDAEVDAFRNELISEGHDGIYLGDTAADFGSRQYAGTDWWIAFHPNQIKSVFAKSFTDSNNIME